MVSHRDYSAELFDAYPDRGHPIADPQPGFVPSTTKFLPRVDLGDVGYIQHNHGRFIRLFNVHKPPGTDGQPSLDRLPAGFEVLDRAAVQVQEGQVDKNLFKSKSITQFSADTGVSGSAASLIPLQGTFNFKSTRQRGAILVTPGPARITTLDASPRGVKLYKEYAAKHMLNWLTFFENEGLDWGDFILVTGVDLTASWATAVFKSSNLDLGLGLDISYVTVGGVRAAAKLSWSHDEVAMTNSTPLTQDGPNVEPNQAIFIRRLRAKRGILGLSLKANAEPRDIDIGRDPDIGSDPTVGVEDECNSYIKLEDDVQVKMEADTKAYMGMEEDSESSVKMEENMKPYIKVEDGIKPGMKTENTGDIRPDDVEMEEVPERDEFTDSLNPALDYILEHSNAQVALVHDFDIPTYNRLTTRMQSKGVVVTEDGVGMLCSPSTPIMVPPPRPEISESLTVSRSTSDLGWAVPPRILLVEDDIVSRGITGKFLQEFGVSFDIAVDGLDAIQRTNLNKYDLVLMDIVMPKLDGVTATNIIRQSDRDTPIISMTANSKPHDLLMFHNSGMTAHLPKPFTKSGLQCILEKYIVDFQEKRQLGAPGMRPGLGPLSTIEEQDDGETVFPSDQLAGTNALQTV